MEEQDSFNDYVLPHLHERDEKGAKEQQQAVAIDGQRGSVRSEVCAVDRVKGMFVGASERRGIFSHYVPPADLLVLWVYIADPPPQGAWVLTGKQHCSWKNMCARPSHEGGE